MVKEKDILYISSGNEGECITSEYWPSDSVKVIKMKNGDYVLGVDVQYWKNRKYLTFETCRIFLDDKNIPYIQIKNNHDFTKENCASLINFVTYPDGSSRYIVAGGSLLNIDSEEKSVFRFSGKMIEEPTIRSYISRENLSFLSYLGGVELSGKAMAILLKFVESFENRKLIDGRFQNATEEELGDLRRCIEEENVEFFKGGDNREKIYELMNKYHLLNTREGYSVKNIIEIDLTKYEYLLKQEDLTKQKHS